MGEAMVVTKAIAPGINGDASIRIRTGVSALALATAAEARRDQSPALVQQHRACTSAPASEAAAEATRDQAQALVQQQCIGAAAQALVMAARHTRDPAAYTTDFQTNGSCTLAAKNGGASDIPPKTALGAASLGGNAACAEKPQVRSNITYL